MSRRVTATPSLGPLSTLERNGDFRYSDDEDEFTSNEDGSDSEPLAIDDRRPVRPRKGSRSKILPNARVFNHFDSPYQLGLMVHFRRFIDSSLNYFFI